MWGTAKPVRQLRSFLLRTRSCEKFVILKICHASPESTQCLGVPSCFTSIGRELLVIEMCLLVTALYRAAFRFSSIQKTLLSLAIITIKRKSLLLAASFQELGSRF